MTSSPTSTRPSPARRLPSATRRLRLGKGAMVAATVTATPERRLSSRLPRDASSGEEGRAGSGEERGEEREPPFLGRLRGSNRPESAALASRAPPRLPPRAPAYFLRVT